MDIDKHSTPDFIRPLPLWGALFLFGVPAGLLFLSIYHLVPHLTALGLAQYVSLDVAFLLPFALLFCLSLVAYAFEGHAWTWAAFRERFRLGDMRREDWLWTAGLLAFTAVAYLPLRAAVRQLVLQGTVPLPDSLPAILDPRTQQSVASLMGGRATGNWSLALVSLSALFFNVFGEELWWRGYILPRQVAAHGRHAWVAHGVLWVLFHAFKYWEFAALLPGCLALAYVAQRRQSTWPGVVVHGALNGLESIYVLLLVVGAAPA
jgi:membrane protease YdiL (CAAX protease family)